VIDDAIRERDAYFTEAARTKETLAEIIPALEIASKCRADDLRATCPGNSLTPDEWAALWMARAILEADSPNESSSPAADLLEEKKTQEAKRDALAQGDKWYHWHDGVAHGLHVAVEHLRMTHPVPND
jgi:hypothetical protein